MCGIAGIFSYRSKEPTWEESELLRIREAMASRGPDGSGTMRLHEIDGYRKFWSLFKGEETRGSVKGNEKARAWSDARNFYDMVGTTEGALF
ncbi:MAG: hypothetical protein ACK44W_17610, partial [Planctomycetota bacterium]